MKLNEVAKAIAGALTAAGVAFTAASMDGDVTGTEWATVASAGVMALGLVWAVTEPALKAAAGAVVTGITAWSAAYSDRVVTPVEWVGIGLGLAAALALVGVVQNDPPGAGRHEATP